VINLIFVSDTTTHEIKWEGAFNAISSDIKVTQFSTLTHPYSVIYLFLFRPGLFK